MINDRLGGIGLDDVSCGPFEWPAERARTPLGRGGERRLSRKRGEASFHGFLLGDVIQRKPVDIAKDEDVGERPQDCQRCDVGQRVNE